MSTPAAAPAEPLGEIRLFVPTDWFDLLEDGQDDDAARARIADMVARSYPQHDEALRADFVQAMMAWRRTLLDQGVILDGLIAVPPEQAGDERGATWQVMAGVVDLPTSDPDIDLGEVLVRLLGSRPDASTAYLESYTTDMGLGFGLLDRPVLLRDGSMSVPGSGVAVPEDESEVVAQVGLAVALACPPGGGRGLLVVGTCLDSSQVYGLGALVAVIAGRSVFTGAEQTGDPAPAGQAENDGR
jgi:hypothetical protein